MFSVCTKLKQLRGALKDINKKHFHNISEQVQRAKAALEEAQRNLYISPFNPEFITKERECMATYNKLLDCELSFLQQKARISWSLKGDRCTNFFHSAIKSNRHNNKVLVLYNGLGQRISDQEEIAKELVSFYKDLMGKTSVNLIPDIQTIQSGPCLIDLQAQLLSSPITKDEIKAIFSMDDNKSPGPNRYAVAFYKSSWPVIGDEVSLAIEQFFKMVNCWEW
ncbi:uncharacterized protein LOC109823196 [Asparagus officinalis]|uniref:uncharacterized protein LOC109823196 n=1 Tax=Asparagus officinalis TaxID=4686 RepID=UPI00098E38A7|nr:uncharacterized protein LOC109823196 [Asparagus officinalis]